MAAQTVGSLTFNNGTAGYTLSAGSGGMLILNNSGGTGSQILGPARNPFHHGPAANRRRQFDRDRVQRRPARGLRERQRRQQPRIADPQWRRQRGAGFERHEHLRRRDDRRGRHARRDQPRRLALQRQNSPSVQMPPRSFASPVVPAAQEQETPPPYPNRPRLPCSAWPPSRLCNGIG